MVGLEVGYVDVPRVEPVAADRGRYGAMNVLVLALQACAWALILTCVDSASLAWPLKAAAVLLFCLLMQGVFSMMHEHFHRNAHRSGLVNYLIGLLGSLLFGTSATLHRVQHWGHHVRNRTIPERGEFIHPGESPWLKVVLYYVAILGGLWIAGVVLPFVILVLPYSSVRWLTRTRRFNTYAAAFEQFRLKDWWLVRLEALLLLAFWSTVWQLELWSPQTLAICYGSFAVSWSSLQWVYHVRTPLHVVEGAYNLRANWVVRTFFLNFNYNLTHHRRPHLPWQELPRNTPLQETQPLRYRWIRMLIPPIPMPTDEQALERSLRKTYF